MQVFYAYRCRLTLNFFANHALGRAEETHKGGSTDEWSLAAFQGFKDAGARNGKSFLRAARRFFSTKIICLMHHTVPFKEHMFGFKDHTTGTKCYSIRHLRRRPALVRTFILVACSHQFAILEKFGNLCFSWDPVFCRSTPENFLTTSENFSIVPLMDIKSPSLKVFFPTFYCSCMVIDIRRRPLHIPAPFVLPPKRHEKRPHLELRYPLRTDPEGPQCASWRTRSTFPFFAASTARSALRHTLPKLPLDPQVGLHKVEAEGQLHQTQETKPDPTDPQEPFNGSLPTNRALLTISTAIRTAARPVRLPFRVWSI